MQHETVKGDEVQVRQDFQQPLVIAGKEGGSEGGPRRRALHHPAARQEDKAVLGLRQLAFGMPHTTLPALKLASVVRAVYFQLPSGVYSKHMRSGTLVDMTARSYA